MGNQSGECGKWEILTVRAAAAHRRRRVGRGGDGFFSGDTALGLVVVVVVVATRLARVIAYGQTVCRNWPPSSPAVVQQPRFA
tara:strand:+ start:4202 stop:4450 length:249 start_codon:yes stop_codon:yes gene_type:complete